MTRALQRLGASLLLAAAVSCHSSDAGNQPDGGVGGVGGQGGGGGAAGGGGGGGMGGMGGAGGGGTPDMAMASSGMGPPQVKMFDSHCLSVPDPDVAASDDLVGTAIQWTAYFYKKDGTLDHTYKWSALKGSLVSDTHIVYDPSSKRWFITTIVDLGNNQFGVQVMVSTDATAKTWKVSIPATLDELIDNPEPTVTSDKVVITYHGNCVWAVG
jgi:hypothetical protein